jgi:thiol-disulfide isomerase/thioredoxin
MGGPKDVFKGDSKPGPVGPYGPMAAGTGSVMGAGPMGAGDPSSKDSNSGGSKGELKIILLYAPWCGHSKRMLPDYKKVMSEFDGKVINNKKVSVIMYDSEVDKDVMKEYGVNAFPTLFTENDGVRKPFPHRTYEKISEYIKQNA